MSDSPGKLILICLPCNNNPGKPHECAGGTIIMGRRIPCSCKENHQ